ncbi:TonB-dependent receptor plug [Pseudopedobacter saltans DSM 12145]|uniref:TonB-dependent receptor plug n=1 Tax=Pseudopedobacter saltans (strain ATCC 51119 / DSM 12145 / JCM 21818 / CCUG 39354 / LMG 10337 / NBRC 100064 / NCIMB 13643) TaxID=762903 RepID=F0SCS0_PSESL|nr:SusC/RagA family TonB-linked outer membrane protein [Pseudopedobacter saltans]ADY50659.1 TonB-dependent receptor plug [Pseudopedobacter saltans DSM 12145]
MKLSIVLLLTAFMQIAGAASFAQKLTLTKQNASLKNVLKDLEAKTGYNFIYNTTMLEGTNLVSFNLKEATLEQVLDKALENQSLSYTINGNTVVIIRKTFTEQPKKPIIIKGKVVDKNNEPLPGVGVKIKNTNVMEVTNVNGEYSIRVTDPKSILVFSFIGFQSKEVIVGQQTSINITLNEDVKALSEVVVTALGIQREEKSLGYAVTQVKGEDLMDAVSNNWTDALSGKVAGLNMIKSGGGPAGSNKIILRGESSLSGDNSALIVVDGVVVSSKISEPNGSYLGSENPIDHGNGISDLNPEDIESVTVLKGPGAAALYGSRGSNGAIIITTKSGKPSQKGLGISFNSNSTFGTINRWPDFQYEYGQGAVGSDQYYSWGKTDDGANTKNTGAAWGPKFDGQEYFQWDPNLLGAGLERTPWVPYKNNRKDFFEVSQTYTNSLSVSGGNAKTTARLNFTNLKNEWIVPNTGYNRNTIALNVTQKVNDKLDISTKISYNNKYSDNLPSTGYNNQTVMYNIIALVPNADINWYKRWWIPGQEGLKQIRMFSNGLDNIYLSVNEMLNGSNRDQLIGTISANYEFTKNLNLMVRASMDWSGESRSQKKPKDSARFPEGMFRTQDINMKETNADFLLRYKHKISEDFEANYSFGGSSMLNSYKMISLSADRLRYPGIYTFANRQDRVVASSRTQEYAVNSFYGMAQFAYKNFLYLDITGRNDWASTLATKYSTENTPFFYPSVNLSGIISDIATLPSSISFWKLRASWANVGGGGVTPYQTGYNYVAKEEYSAGMANPTFIANPNLKNELSASIEFGTDIRFFKGRLGLDATYYKSNINNQILRVPVDRATGYSYTMMNSGLVQNKGVEIQLNGTPMKPKKGITWDVSANFAANRNTIVSLADSVTTYLMQSGPRGTMEARVGGRMGDLYGLGYRRNEEGKIIYNDQGYPTLTEEVIYLGKATPDFTWGITNSFKYKQFRFKVLVDGQYGAVAYSHTHAAASIAGKLTNSLPGRYNGIIGDGVQRNPDGTYRPNDVVAQQIGTYYNEHFKSDNVEANTFSTDFIKLREARLDYTLSPKLVKKLKLQRATVGIYGRDLFVWSDWPAYDPEFGTLGGSDIQRGFEVAQFPSTRNFGVNVSFSF